MSNDSLPPPASGASLRPSTPPPSAKKLGKRPMTGVQLQAYYAKMPKVADYDSDAEREPWRSSNCANLTNIPGLQMALPVPTVPRLPPVPINVAPEDEHARDILEALNGVVHTVTPLITTDGSRDLTIAQLANLFQNDADTPNDSNRLVPDPFMPDTCPWITAAERDAVVQAEQEWRTEQGIPLLTRDPEDCDHWVDPAERPGAVVNPDVPDDIYD